MAQVAVIADEANEASGLTFAFGLRGPVMLMVGMLMGITVLLHRRIMVLHGDRVITVLPRRVCAQRHSGSQHPATGEPQDHPSQYKEAKYFHQMVRTSISINGSVADPSAFCFQAAY